MSGKNTERKRTSPYIIFVYLHVLLFIYSITGILSKLASEEESISLRFIALYFGVVFVLGIYALCWQQIIKRIPLSIAYANKAVTTIWGSVWGILLFNDSFNIGKLAGIVLIVAGVILISKEEAHTL